MDGNSMVLAARTALAEAVTERHEPKACRGQLIFNLLLHAFRTYSVTQIGVLKPLGTRAVGNPQSCPGSALLQHYEKQ